MCKYYVFIMASCLLGASALPSQQRIAGGTVATLGQHPYAAAIFFAGDNMHFHLICGGAILNNRTVLSVTTCWLNAIANQFRIRVGAIKSNYGGSLHNVNLIISAPSYSAWNRDHNIGLLRVNPNFQFGYHVKPIAIAGVNLAVADNVPVWTVGWGRTTVYGTPGTLHRVDIRTLPQVTCQSIYGLNFITLNMLCAGWPESPRGACAEDMGSPLVRNNVTVGVTSYVVGCGHTHFPVVYTRVSRYTNWIINNS